MTAFVLSLSLFRKDYKRRSTEEENLLAAKIHIIYALDEIEMKNDRQVMSLFRTSMKASMDLYELNTKLLTHIKHIDYDFTSHLGME
jgi:hypothetical protein